MIHVLHILEDEIVFLHKGLPQPEINKRIALFRSEGPANANVPRYIVATTSAFGVGITLSECISVGLLEPDYRVAMELQAFSRHDRQGNLNPRTYSWYFYNEGHIREERIRQTNHLLKGLVSDLDQQVRDQVLEERMRPANHVLKELDSRLDQQVRDLEKAWLRKRQANDASGYIDDVDMDEA